MLYKVFSETVLFLLKDNPVCILLSAQTADTNLRHVQIIILISVCKNDNFVIYNQYSYLLW